MDCVWSVSGMEHFGKRYAEVHGWRYYNEMPTGECDTCLIVGMYDPPDFDYTNANTQGAARRLIHWSGSDAFMLTRPEMLPDATHIADSKGVAAALWRHGIEAPVIWCPTIAQPVVTPLPEKPTVSIYFGSVPENYGAQYVRFLQETMPEVSFRAYTSGQNTPEQMLEVIDQTTVALRLTAHDGSAVGVREMMQAGRYCVTTQDLPFARKVTMDDPVGVISALKSALRHKEPDNDAAAFYAAHNSADEYLRRMGEVM